MKRLVLAVAAVVAGSGCIVTEDHHAPPSCASNVTLEWDFQTWPVETAAPIVTGCAGAGVSSVDVYMDDVYAATFDCYAGGGAITSVPAGVHLFTAEGMGPTDTNGFRPILYRDEVNVDSSSCVDQFVPVRPAEGRANLNYPSWSGCSAGTCFVWFSVHDDIANQTAAVVDGATYPQTYPYPSDAVFRLPVGNYSLDWFQLVAPPPPSSYSEVAKVCGNPAFAVSAAHTTDLGLTLLATGATCP